MKLRIRDQKEPEQEQVVEVWLEKRYDGCVDIKAEIAGTDDGWYLATIKQNGIFLQPSLPDSFGFPTDNKGRVKVVD